LTLRGPTSERRREGKGREKGGKERAYGQGKERGEMKGKKGGKGRGSGGGQGVDITCPPTFS